MPEHHSLHLPDKYLQIVKKLLQSFVPQAEVLAYGSRVQGDHFDASDLDLLVRFPLDKRPAAFNLSELREAFSESDLPIIVQIVEWDAIPESFKQEILAAHVVVQKASDSADGAAN